MQYDAITLDTSIFESNGLHLEKGLLEQLSQFKTGSADFVLSEIIIRELRKHLVVKAKEARDILETATKKAEDSGLLPPDKISEMKQTLDKLEEPEQIAKKRLKKFLDKTGAEIIAVEPYLTMESLIKQYFDAKAPFEEDGKKKNEFPDAMALLSLEAWAQKHDKKLFAVSGDKGWALFGQGSVCIDVGNDLAAALEKFQKYGEQAEASVVALLAKMDEGDAPKLLKELEDFLSSAVSEMDVYAEADSWYSLEENQLDISLETFDFLKDEDEYPVHIVQVLKDKIVAEVPLTLKVKAECEFSLYVWDSIDKENVGMGSAAAETEEEFDASVLITFAGNFKHTEGVHIVKVELTDTPRSIDFGEVSLDHEPDYDEPEPEEPDNEENT